MSKINASKETIDYINKAKPGDKTVYLNMEALKRLPKEYESTIVELKFDRDQDFDDIGNKQFMPRPEFMYRIAEARGIYGIGISHTEPVIEPVNLSDMSMSEIPQIVKYLVGYKSVKQSAVLNEDGTERTSSPCTSEYNAWNRCAELWAKEEENTNGYDPKIVKHYPDGNAYYEYTYNRETKKKSLKYDTRFKRKSHFQSELKFALAKAETKAYLKTIRELAGLMTGYSAEDLKPGKFYFAKIVRSAEIMALETAARLSNMSKSLDSAIDDQKLLYGSPETEIEELNNANDIIVSQEDAEEEKPKHKLMREIIVYYMQKYELHDLDKIAALNNWLSADIVSYNSKEWESAVKRFKMIESEIPETSLIEHNIY